MLKHCIVLGIYFLIYPKFSENTRSVSECQKINANISILRYLLCYLPHRLRTEFWVGICTHYLAWYVSLKEFLKCAVVIWVSIILDKGAVILELAIVKKVQIVYLLQQLCSCYRITREWNAVALLSSRHQQRTRTPSVSLCADHTMRPWVVWTSHGQLTQSSTCTECQGNKSMTTLNLQDYFSEVTSGTDCNLLCWYKPKVSTASNSV